MAIALGVTWSPAAAALRDLGHLVDFVEAPGWALGDLEGRPIRRTIVHNVDPDFSLAGAGAIDDAWCARANAVIAAVNSPWLSLHLGFASERVRFVEHMLPESPALDRETLRERIVANINRAKGSIRQPLVLENLDYCPEGAYEHVCDPTFISEIIAATGTELLLDTGHLRVSASWFGLDPLAMLEALPLDRVLEVHVSSPRPLQGDNGRLDDAHAELTEVDLDLLREVLQRSSPAALVLEYRRDPEQLRDQLLLLARVTGRVWRGVGC